VAEQHSFDKMEARASGMLGKPFAAQLQHSSHEK
jgi:hypothetical protein